MIRSFLTFGALFLFLASAAMSSPAAELQGTARLVAREESIVVINGVVSLPVRALPVVPGEPVTKGSVLLEINAEKLDRELRERQNDLRRIQEEKRFRASNREVQRGGGSSQFQGPDNSMDATLAMREGDAMRDLLEVQTKLSTASPRAPEDGYLLRAHYAVGAETKRRKPLVSFVPANKTELEVILSGATAADYPSGAEVAVTSAADGAQRFRATVVSIGATTGSGGVELALRPLELPFLALDRPTEVVVTPAR